MDVHRASIQRGAVAAATVAAAHRRDHRHAADELRCRPHLVQVIGLGRRAVVVCHDCCLDSGYLDDRQAERLASRHRYDTLTADAPLTAGTAG